MDVSRLDIRIGRVLSVRRHPLAETLSVQVVELGEPAPRTVVSKLSQKQDVEEVKETHTRARTHTQTHTHTRTHMHTHTHT